MHTPRVPPALGGAIALGPRAGWHQTGADDQTERTNPPAALNGGGVCFFGFLGRCFLARRWSEIPGSNTGDCSTFEIFWFRSGFHSKKRLKHESAPQCPHSPPRVGSTRLWIQRRTAAQSKQFARANPLTEPVECRQNGLHLKGGAVFMKSICIAVD